MSVVGVSAAQVLESAPVAQPNLGTELPKTGEMPADAPPVQDPGVARQFAALSKKEKALFREREAFKAEKAALAADRARIAELEAKYGVKPRSPREALERYGFDYKQATEFELNDGAPTAEHMARQAQEEVAKIRAEQVERDRKAAEDAAKRAEADKVAVEQDFQVEINTFIDEKAEEYELIKFNGAQGVVYATVEEHYLKTGRLLSIPEAANMVEKYLEKRLDDLEKVKKFAKRRQAEPQTPAQSGQSRQPEVLAQRRTLDNTVTSSTPTLVRSPRVEDDRMARALAALDRK